MIKKNVKNFGIINTVEGYSYLALVFIAMPMKYILGIAIATKIVGSIHGALFAIFCVYLIFAAKDAKWGIKKSIKFFIAALIPFGTFYTKKEIQSYE
ncbi:MAG: DUF3817 domain-containing protein [Campylobacterota bacterium]|nr:DUF3817 domain-containing protein [Campylobacterota bacterium]